MAEQLKPVTKSAESIAPADLPDEVAKAAEGKDVDKWYFATVEVADREKDVVRVKGLDTKRYSQHGGPIKVLVSHRKSPDASNRLPIVGGVVEWVATKHKATGAPAMAAGLKFVDTDLGREAKVLADANLLDVSIGFEPLEGTPIQGGGMDYTKAAIAEISICTHGMNQLAGQFKADDVSAKLDELTNQITKRLDNLESAIVATAKEVEPPGDPDSTANEKSDDATLLAFKRLLDERFPTAG